MRYLLVTLPASIILAVSLITPILIVMRSRISLRIDSAQFEVIRFRRMASLVLWLIPTSIVWTFVALIVWISSWPEHTPEPGRVRLISPDSDNSKLKGYLIYLALVLIYCVGCYLLVRWNSKRFNLATGSISQRRNPTNAWSGLAG
jgi:hypothetical protein